MALRTVFAWAVSDFSDSCQDLRNDAPWNAAEVIPSTELLRSVAEKCRIGHVSSTPINPPTSLGGSMSWKAQLLDVLGNDGGVRVPLHEDANPAT